jgi:flagellin
MGLSVNTNVSFLNALGLVFTSGQAFNSSFKRLSSRFIIHRASVAAAILKISKRLTTQAQGLHQTFQNTTLHGQNAGGSVGKVITSLQRIRNLLVQFKNGINFSDVHNSLKKKLQTSKKNSKHILSDTHFTNLDILHSHFSAKFLVGKTVARLSLSTYL